MIDIGNLVKSCREFVGMTQSELVSLVKLPITQPELSAIESGKRKKVSFVKVFALINAMGLEVAIHEGIVVNDKSDIPKLRRDFRVTLKKLAKDIDVHEVSLSRQEREGSMRVNRLLKYLAAMDLKIVLIDDGIDINDFVTMLDDEENGIE